MKIEVQKWFNDGGDNKFRYNYHLNEKSLVFDCGGYKGEWSEKIYNLYSCNIFIFEPIKKYYNIIEEKFKNNNKVKVFNFGLSDMDKSIKITLSDDGSSIYINSGIKELIELRGISNFINDNEVRNINLLKLNVEGEEYNILDDIIKNGLTDIVDNYQIQFHEVVENYDNLRKNIREVLNKTHNETYCYEYVWENWEKKI